MKYSDSSWLSQVQWRMSVHSSIQVLNSLLDERLVFHVTIKVFKNRKNKIDRLVAFRKKVTKESENPHT